MASGGDGGLREGLYCVDFSSSDRGFSGCALVGGDVEVIFGCFSGE